MGENKVANEEPVLNKIWPQEEIKHIMAVYNQKAISLNTLAKLDKLHIGQIVHYYDHYHHQRAAIITAIHQDGSTCDLCVLYPTRQEFRQSVKHDSDHEKETWDFTQ